MATKLATVQGTLFDGPITRTRFRYAPGEFREKRENVQLEYCENPSCHLNASRNGWRKSSFIVGKRIRVIEKYAPRQDVPDRVYYCPDCAESVGHEDSSWCGGCDREVYITDGYTSYWKELNGNYVCIYCWEIEVLRDGAGASNAGAHDFTNTQLIEAGYKKLIAYDCDRPDEKAEYAAKIRNLQVTDAILYVLQDLGYQDRAIWIQ